MLDHSYTIIEPSSYAKTGLARRFVALYLMLGLLLVVLASRSFYLQIWQGGRWLSRAEYNRVTATTLIAPRGIIYDQYRTQLVENIASTDLVLDPFLLPTAEHEATLIERLPRYLAITPEAIIEILHIARRSQRVGIVAKALDHEQVLQLEAELPNLPGLRLSSSLVRKYPRDHALAHALGYTSPVTSDELKDRNELIPTDITGKTGLEKYYDDALHGQAGAIRQEVDAAGNLQKQVSQSQPTAGSDLLLGLDGQLQQYIYDALADRAQQLHEKDPEQSTSAAVVALDPRSGAIRALVNYPSFDPNIFSQPQLRRNATDLFAEPQQPLFNRAADGSFSPGSTIKPLLAAAGLQENIITTATTINSTGGLAVGPWNFPDWKSGGHGVTDVHKAIAESVNTFFYVLTGGEGNHPGLGVERATHYLSQFGWGKPTGIDLPTEADGFLPSKSWKESAKQEPWYIGDTYHLGIGQGDVLASPLQITAAIAALAHDGTWRQPHLVEVVQPPNRNEQKISVATKELPIDQVHISTIKEAMRQTVTEGSGRLLATLPIALAGKTGTAQIGGTEATHAWFVSFGPYETPELVLTVLLEKGGAGDKDAVPVAQKIWQWWIKNRHCHTGMTMCE